MIGRSIEMCHVVKIIVYLSIGPKRGGPIKSRVKVKKKAQRDKESDVVADKDSHAEQRKTTDF